jgi:hypothetical protein
MPEIITAVKQGVIELFTNGQIPKLNEFINPSTITVAINQAVEEAVQTSIELLHQDTEWLAKVEIMINQTVIRQTLANLGSMDIATIIRDRVDENVDQFVERLRSEFSSVGISDKATKNQMTVMDSHTVFENILTAQDLEIANGAVINNLVVKGSINTDNLAWNDLSIHIAQKTLEQIEETLQPKMVQQIADLIEEKGIEFTQVKVDGEYLVAGDTLSHLVTRTNIQKLGRLDNLEVRGPASIYETFNVVNKRIGVNSEEPEMALSVWDEEVAINIGKSKLNQAYIGTSRPQELALGVNRVGQLIIDTDGLTTVKKLQVGLHKISHDVKVPGWSGTRGDIVFNANPTDRVFAWVCLGAFKWQPLKSAE